MTWSTVELGDVADVVMGQSPPGDTYNENGEGLPFFQGKADFGERFPDVRKWCTAPKKVAELGDILLSVRAPVGPTNVARERSCIGRGLAAIRGNPERLDQNYLRRYLQHRESTLAFKGQGSTFAAISRAEIETLSVPLPRLSEQRRIVEIVDQADRLRQLRTDADARADRVLAALFLKMFSHADSVGPAQRFDVLVKIGAPFVEPNQREYLDLLHVGGQQIEKNTGRILDPRSVKESQLRSGKFLFTEQHVLYSKIRPYLNKVAYPRFSGLCSADIYPLLPRDRRIGPWFLTALLRSEAFRTYAKGQSDRLRIPKLNRAQLGSYAVRVPHPRALAAFESRAEELALTEERRLQSRARVGSLFKLVLHRSFRGEVTAPSCEGDLTELQAHTVATTPG